MKRLKCPQCGEFIFFDETDCDDEFAKLKCENCGKAFKIRLKKQEERSFGSIVVVENVFCERQEFSLKLGDNLFGRKCFGTVVDAAIDTGDMSMDRKHVIFNVSEKGDELIYTVRDNESLTGTFVMNDILQKNERRILEDNEIITIGATTLILKKKVSQ